LISRKYKKRPVEIEAVQLHMKLHNEISDWITVAHKFTPEGVIIETLEGEMLGCWGDYIVKGVKGEFYPVRRDIFHLTYEVGAGEPTEEEK
jgi:hypothetical protein